MKHKLKDLIQNDKKLAVLSIAAFVVVIALTVTTCVLYNNRRSDGMNEADISKIEVSEDEVRLYRERIGSDMDIKKAVFILFNTEDECRSFISEHGADNNPIDAGLGIVPLMQDGYYNIVGKGSLEEMFDSLKDGEYTLEPISYSNLYCYIKRIGVNSPLNSDEELKKLIQRDKYYSKKYEKGKK